MPAPLDTRRAEQTSISDSSASRRCISSLARTREASMCAAPRTGLICGWNYLHLHKSYAVGLRTGLMHIKANGRVDGPCCVCRVHCGQSYLILTLCTTPLKLQRWHKQPSHYDILFARGRAKKVTF